MKYLWFSGTGSINNFSFVIILHAFCVWVSGLCVLKLNNNNDCKCLLLCAVYDNGLFCISPYVHFISVITTYLHLIIMFYIMFVVLMVTWHTFWYAVESACTCYKYLTYFIGIKLLEIGLDWKFSDRSMKICLKNFLSIFFRLNSLNIFKGFFFFMITWPIFFLWQFDLKFLFKFFIKICLKILFLMIILFSWKLAWIFVIFPWKLA